MSGDTLANRVVCLASSGQAGQLRRVLEEAGFEVAVVDSLELHSHAATPQAKAAVADYGAFGSAPQFAAFLAEWSTRTPVLGTVPGAVEEAAVLLTLAQLHPCGPVGLCRAEDFAAQAGARLGLLVSRSKPDSLVDKDPLTGLGSREAMRERLAHVLSDLPSVGVAAAFILDLDHFKSINDSLGHAAGDQVLRAVAQRVMNFSALRKDVFRLGGDEISGLLTGRSRPEIEDTLEQLRRAIEESTVRIEQEAEGENAACSNVSITASIGFAFLVPSMATEEVYKQADAALYAAKSAGRNRVRCHDLCWDAAAEDSNLAALAHFENVTRVWTERMSELIMSVGRKAMEETRRSAERDGLTDLFNRRYFDRRIAREIENARRSAAALSLILLDVDNFHEVNMKYGYPTGDRALKAVADLAQNHSRATDWVARYGGEEFCVIMPGASSADASLVAERLRAALEASTVAGYEKRTLRLTACFGVACLAELTEGKLEAAALVQLASDRVVRAKGAGKNRVVGPEAATGGTLSASRQGRSARLADRELGKR